MMQRLMILAAEPGATNEAILPHDLDEVWWGTVGFLVIFALLAKFAFPPIKRWLIERRETIRIELEDAAQRRAEAEARLEDVRQRLSATDEERQRILDEARESAEALAADLDERARTEVADLRARAQRDIAASQQQAMADLQAMVGQLALGAAEVVVRNSLDEGAQRDLIDRYITQLGAP